jgi:hypothetical protein
MEEQFGFDHASALVFASGMPNQMLTNALNRQGSLPWMAEPVDNFWVSHCGIAFFGDQNCAQQKKVSSHHQFPKGHLRDGGLGCLTPPLGFDCFGFGPVLGMVKISSLLHNLGLLKLIYSIFID